MRPCVPEIVVSVAKHSVQSLYRKLLLSLGSDSCRSGVVKRRKCLTVGAVKINCGASGTVARNRYYLKLGQAGHISSAVSKIYGISSYFWI